MKLLQKIRKIKGQGLSEYLIMLGLVAIGTIGAVMYFSDNVREQIHDISKELVGEDEDVTDNVTNEPAAIDQYNMSNYVDSQE